MKKTVSKIALVALSGLATMLAGCPDGPTEDAGGGPTACETNDDCGEGEVCNGTTDFCEEPCDPTAANACDEGDACYGDSVAGDNVCQTECENNAACGANRTCNLTTGQCIYGCDSAEDLRLICAGATDKCDTTTGECVECLANADCTAPQICNLNTGSCQAPGTCDAPGTLGDAPCAATELCMPDGSCENPCDDDACAANSNLCQDDLANAAYNSCVDHDLVRSDCPSVGAHTSDAGGPTVISVSYVSTGAACGNGTEVRYSARVYSSDNISGNLYTAGIQLLTNGNPANTFSNGPGTPSHPVKTDNGGGLFTIAFSLCQIGVNDTFAIITRDPGNNDSNGACFDSGI
jgi:hypothetical protein